MLGKIQKDHDEDDLVSDSGPNSSEKQTSSSVFSIPRLFVGFTAKGPSDSDSVRSPTSPLDSKLFSGFGSSFWSQRSEIDALQNQKKSWCSKGIGLGIVDSLTDVKTKYDEIAVGKSESKNILFGSQLKIGDPQCKGSPNNLLEMIGPCVTSPQSLPICVFSPQRGTKTGLSHLGCSHFAQEPNAASSQIESSIKYSFCSCESVAVDAEILTRSQQTGFFCSDSGIKMSTSDSGSRSVIAMTPEISSGSSFSITATVSARDIELSEDYTRVITHGPNPKTKHIYGNLVLEENNVFENSVGNKPDSSMEEPLSCMYLLMDDFLSVCYACKKKLEEGEDIYVYRGEKAFCSFECRLQEIMIDEEMEKASVSSSPPSTSSSCDDEIFSPGLPVAT